MPKVVLFYDFRVSKNFAASEERKLYFKFTRKNGSVK